MNITLLVAGLTTGGQIAGLCVGLIIGALILGAIIGFIVTRILVKKQLKDNPPITEKQIRAMYMSMGRKPSERDIKKTMNAIKRAK